MKEKTNPLVNRWQLLRQDDNGNLSVVDSFASEEEASEAMAFYESKVHKQTYWIEFTEAAGLLPLSTR